MSDLKLPSRSEDFSEWYNELVLRAELADYAPVLVADGPPARGNRHWSHWAVGSDFRLALARRH